MFTDRKRFYVRYLGNRVLSTRYLLHDGKFEAAEGVFQPSNPSCFNVYAGITRFGATILHEVAGSTKYAHEHVNAKGSKARNITKQ